VGAILLPARIGNRFQFSRSSRVTLRRIFRSTVLMSVQGNPRRGGKSMQPPNYHSIAIATFAALLICAATITLNPTQQGTFSDPEICSLQEVIFSPNDKTASFQPLSS
jgi:hypothetical protein